MGRVGGGMSRRVRVCVCSVLALFFGKKSIPKVH